ncbi:hypothetical protein MMC11_005292 [Xylographa trunciseda]|nr:hypothetical protein [Xylographa trunciseda]
MAKTRPVLSQEDIDHFLAHGWVRVTDCFSRSRAEEWTSNLWVRLGMDPIDKSTWNKERINMPHHQSMAISEIAPRAWQASCELLGGADRIKHNEDGSTPTWNDGLIVNLGTDERAGKKVEGRALTNWHVDGDFFIHFLDSGEQGLLLIPLFSDIKPDGGGTMICPEGITKIAKHLYDHPEGVTPRMTPRGQKPKVEPEGLNWYIETIQSCDNFVEAHGNVGDVYLLHPLMLHSASNNSLRIPRIIINPPVSLKEPFNFDRENAEDYSIVERKTLRELGKERLSGWKIKGEREAVIPARLKPQAKMMEEELKRLAALKQEKCELKPLDNRISVSV